MKSDSTIFKQNDFFVVDNFLEPDKFKDIQDLELEYNKEKDEYKVNYLSQKDIWPETLFKKDGVESTEMLVQLENYYYRHHDEKPMLHLQNKIISYMKNNLKQNLYLESPTKKFYLVSKFFFWKNANIMWHNDYGYDYGITYYISDTWKDNWGGELLLGNGNWVSPKPNRIVFIKNSLPHKTSPVMEGAGDRISVQTFIQKDFDENKIGLPTEKLKQLKEMSTKERKKAIDSITFNKDKKE